MRRTTSFIAIAVITILIGTLGVGCKETTTTQGPAGATGATGETGATGAQGAPAAPTKSEKSSESTTTTTTNSNAPDSGSGTTTQKSTTEKSGN